MHEHTLNALGQAVGHELPDWKACPQPDGRALQGQRVRLERLDAKRHGADLFAADKMDASGASWTYLPYGPFETSAEHLAWIEGVAQRPDPMFYAIVEPMRGAVGQAALMRIETHGGVIEIGHIHFSPGLMRSARATEAILLLLREAFDLGYRRVEWKCHALNVSSRRAAERLGFTFEGVFRQATVVKGRNRDTAWYSMLDIEWPANHAAFQAWLHPNNFDAMDGQIESLSRLRSLQSTP